VLAAGVVVVEAGGLEELHGDGGQAGEELAGDDGADDQGDEDYEHDEVEDGIADYSALAELALLQRVDGRPDLATRS